MTRILALALACLTPFAAPAQDLEEGADLFVRYCATCHGMEARGDGPMASIMIIQPTDLTALAAENGGVFPRISAIARIDGRDPLIAHGSPMPIFGGFFEGQGETIRGEDGVLIMTSKPVLDLLAYLESIQD